MCKELKEKSQKAGLTDLPCRYRLTNETARLRAGCPIEIYDWKPILYRTNGSYPLICRLTNGTAGLRAGCPIEIYDWKPILYIDQWDNTFACRQSNRNLRLETYSLHWPMGRIHWYAGWPMGRLLPPVPSGLQTIAAMYAPAQVTYTID